MMNNNIDITKWFNEEQLINKKIYNKDFTCKIDVIEQLISYFNKKDKYFLLNEEINETIKNNLKYNEIIFSTPILKSCQNDGLMSSCYLHNFDNFNELLTFIRDKNNNFSSGGFGLNISTFEDPLIAIKYIQLMAEQQNNKHIRFSTSALSLELYCEDFLKVTNFYDIKSGKLNIYSYLNITFNDLFFEKVLNDEDWYFIKYDYDLYMKLKYSSNDEFKQIYNNIEDKYKIKINANKLLLKIIDFISFNNNVFVWNKDAANRITRDNYKTITTTNLCTEIIQSTYGNRKTTYCTLGAINLSNMVNSNNELDLEKIVQCAESLTYAISIITNKLDYVDNSTEYDNTHDISIGIVGYSDLLDKLNINYKDGREIMWKCLQSIYYGAIKTSITIANKCKDRNLQFFLIKEFPFEIVEKEIKNLKNGMKDFGLIYDFEQFRNKLKFNRRVTALMPTSTTSEILNVNQSFHLPFTKKYIKSSNNKSILIERKGLTMVDLTLLEQLQYNIDRQFFLDNTSSQEIFINNDNLPNELFKYYINCYFNGAIIYQYYLHVNENHSKHIKDNNKNDKNDNKDNYENDNKDKELSCKLKNNCDECSG